MVSQLSTSPVSTGKKVIPYLMAGDNGLENTRKLLKEAKRNGVWAVELGIPFSDPTADGPVIQKAAIRALTPEISFSRILSFLEEIPLSDRPPIFIMTYFNLFLSLSIPEFVARAKRAGGIKGAVIPDLSFEDSKSVRKVFHRGGLALVPFISPTTSQERIKKILATAEGFIYFVSLLGTTGKALTLSSGIRDAVHSLQEKTKLPVCVGFGIQTPEMVRDVLSFADGVIIGSRLVQEESDPVQWGRLLEQFCEAARSEAPSHHQKG